jgi:uncharacterized protein YjdB
MKNYFKKFSIMFVMLLSVLGVGIIQNGIIANAATIGQQLTAPESGWQRNDDKNNKIKYNGTWSSGTGDGNWYKGTYCQSTDTKATAEYKFYGSKLRVINPTYTNQPDNMFITIDGVKYNYSCTGPLVPCVIVFEKLDLNNGIHTVKMEADVSSVYKSLSFDAIDIEDTGYLVDPNSQVSSISLDNTAMSLKLDNSKQLTAITTPAGAKVVWSSSDESIATVDQNGKVKGIKEGTATITAQIEDADTKATCEVTVTDGGVIVVPDPPVDEPTGDGGLFIELVDGNIKQYDVSSDEINKFINWYNNRDNDDSQPPYYKFTKGSYKDYVVHDKIDWFEVR